MNGRHTTTIAMLPFDLILDASGRKQMRNMAFELAAKRGEVIAEEGYVDAALLSVAEGFIKLSKVLADGRRLILGFRGPGDLLSLHRSDAPWPTTAQALTDCRLVRIEWRDFRRLAERYPGLNRALFDLASDETTILQDRLLSLGRKTTEERLASFLLEFLPPAAAPSSFSREILLPMRRPEIADYLAMTTESISREFTRFKRQSLIAMPRPSCVVVLNRPALETRALGRSNPGTRSSERAPRNGKHEREGSAVAALEP